MRAYLRLSFLFVVLACWSGVGGAPSARAQSPVYVDVEADGAQDGSSWSDAYTHLQDAIRAAGPNDEIWVAEGTYTPVRRRSDAFVITGQKDGVAVYGGFAGHESTRRARRPGAHPVVLSGHVGAGTDGADNSDHVLVFNGGTAWGRSVASNVTPATVVSGVTVTGGVADGTGVGESGGGVFCDGRGRGNACSPTLANVVVRGNVAADGGGGMYNDGTRGGASSPRIVSSVFVGNRARGGGGLFNQGTMGTSSPQLANVTIVQNVAEEGGGMLCRAGGDGTSQPMVVNTIFWANEAPDGAEMYNDGVGATPAVRRTLVDGGVNGAGIGGTVNESVGTNFTAYPGFLNLDDPDGVDNVAGTSDDGLRLTVDSPVLDAGVNAALDANGDGTRDWTIDVTGTRRVQVGGGGASTVDLGAYEGAASDSARTFYVDVEANGRGDGTSWADAYTRVQPAIEAATDNDEIWIAEGTYTPGRKRDDSFVITGREDGVEIYGGFAGTETTRQARRPSSHSVVLSGNIGDRADAMDNSYHVVVFDGGAYLNADVGGNVTPETVLSGVTVSGGTANGDKLDGAGGGIVCDGYGIGNACSPTLSKVRFVGNYATDGGAMYNGGGDEGNSSPRIRNSVFVGNRAGHEGGALYNQGYQGTSSPQLTNVTFTDNKAGSGGALFNQGTKGTSRPRVTNTILWGNQAGRGLGGRRSAEKSGPEICNEGAGTTLVLTHSLLQGGRSGIGENKGSSTIHKGGNVNGAPRFFDATNPSGADDVLGTYDDGLRLTPGSPAVDAGTNAALDTNGDGTRDLETGLTGETRLKDDDGDGQPRVDIGAYERTVSSSPR